MQLIKIMPFLMEVKSKTLEPDSPAFISFLWQILISVIWGRLINLSQGQFPQL